MPSRLFLYLYALLLLVKAESSHAQMPASKSFGVGIGLVTALGTKFDRIGFCLRGFYTYQSFQLNADLRVYGNIRNLGPPGAYTEGVISLGLVYGYGRTDSTERTLFLSSVSNQMALRNSIGYAHNFYINPIGTSQHTGVFSFQFGKISLISENDIFGHSFYDRFRTGAILLQYTQGNRLQLALNCSMWTGQLEHTVRGTDYPNANGYMDTTHSRYAGYSHGLLSLQAKTLLPVYEQQAQVNLGVDAEQVRNAVQNKFIHDLVFLPVKWRSSRNVHMPMIDDKGNQYLYKEGQKIKPASLYLNGFLNPSVFY
jgi:hypothetical protein